MSVKYHVNPRFRAYGKARLDVTMRAKDEQEWQEMWREPLHSFPFKFSSGWKFGFEYKVDDFAAEVGFFIDVLGFSVRAFSPRYAQFSSPGDELILSVLAAGEDDESTPADTIRLYLQISGAEETISELNSRGIVFDKAGLNDQGSESVFSGFFRTPHGIRIDLWDQFPLSPDTESLAQYEGDDLEETEVIDEAEDFAEDDDLDEDEADRLIDSLLGLADEDSASDVYTDASEVEEPDDSDEEDFEVTAEDEESEEDDPVSHLSQEKSGALQDNPPQTGAKSWKPAQRSPQKERSQSRLPARVSSSRSTNWPTDDDRRNGELSYEEIEDEY